jgi:hypothetical protein
VSLLSRRRERRIANAVISEPDDHTTMDRSGAVRSIQAANVDLPISEFNELWSPTNLERLARTYWYYLSLISLGLIRVHYGPHERAVVFLTRPFVLLRFGPPEYELTDQRGVVRWSIRDGLLVARRDDGYLEIDVRRTSCDRPGFARAHVEVEVANFYPALARPFKWFYTNTQSRIHVIVTKGFLKRLARHELEESAVGRFAQPTPMPGTEAALAGGNGNGNGFTPEVEPEDQLVGSSPWAAVAALAASFALLAAVFTWAVRADRVPERLKPHG